VRVLAEPPAVIDIDDLPDATPTVQVEDLPTSR
jgi:hypothetical protein